MAIGCEDVSARMMDLLYGELSGDDRAAVEAHLAGCPSCRAELAAFQGTRAAARRALEADAPPARAHEAILRAAAAAAKQAQPIAGRPAPAPSSFWQRLRARWVLPTFATVGAVAVVVLASKVFLEPDKTVELGRQTLQSAPPLPPAAPEAPTTPTAALAGPEPRPEPPRGDLGTRVANAETEAKKRSAPPVAAAAHRAVASGPGSRRKVNLDGLAAPQEKKPSGEALGAGEQPLDDLRRGEAGSGSAKDRAPPARPAQKAAKGEFALPPPPRAQPGPAKAPTASRGKFDMVDDDSDGMPDADIPARAGLEKNVTAGAAAPPPAAHAAPKAKKGPARLDEEPENSAAAEAPAPAPLEEEQAEEASVARKESKPGNETPVAHADRLFAEGRWGEAARAYRELLRRDPNNSDAARWRQRLGVAEEEAAGRRPPAAAAPAASKAR